MSLDKHVADIFYGLELVADGHTDAVISIVIITGIASLILSVQCGEDFHRLYTQVGHAVLKQGDVDAFGTLAVEVHSIHALDIVHFPFHQFGIIGQFAVVHSFACQGIEHTEHIAEVVLNHRRADTFWQRGLCIAHLPAEHVPALLYLIIIHGAEQLDLYQREVVVRVAFDVIHIPHRTDFLLQYVGYFQFHLMCRCTRIGGDHHRQFHLHFGVFELAHLPSRKHTAHHEDGDEEINQVPVSERPFSHVCLHNNPPTLVSVVGGSGFTFSPLRMA